MAHGALTEPSLITPIGKGREGKGKGNGGWFCIHAFSLRGLWITRCRELVDHLAAECKSLIRRWVR